MALLSHALTSVDSLLSYMGQIVPDEDLISIYHDGSGGVTTGGVNGLASGLQLVTNLGDETVLYSAFPTVTLLVAEINALTGGSGGSAGWQASVVPGRGAAASSSISVQTHGTGNPVLIAAEVQVIGRNVTTLENAINSATEMIERFLGRRFASTTYNHKLSGSGRRELSLPQWPIISVARVSSGFREFLSVRNTSADATQATALVDETNLTLAITGGSNNGSDSLALATSTTAGALVTAINALGKGWTASLAAGANTAWVTAALFEFNERSCLLRSLSLRGSEETINNYEVDPTPGFLLRISGPDPSRFQAPTAFGFFGRVAPFELRPITAKGSGPFWREGYLNYFVRYTAGFATIPADLESYANEVAANITRRGRRDTSLTAESLDGYSYSTQGEAPLTKGIKEGLVSYKRLIGTQFAEV